MPYSNVTFNVSTNLSFKPNDFVQLNGSLITTTTTTTTAAPLPVITSGLVLYVDASIPSSYPGTGTTWYDLSPSGYNGTLSGSTAFNSANGGYISLQSNTGYIDFGLGSAGSSSSAYSAGAWFKPTTVSSTTVFMARGNDMTGGYPSGWNFGMALATTDFRTGIVTSTPGIAQVNVNYATIANTSTWYNVIAVWNPGNSIKLYVNGVLRATTNTSNTVLRNSGTGWNSTDSATKYNSNLGSMMVYNRVLSDAEVLQNFNSTKTRFGY